MTDHPTTIPPSTFHVSISFYIKLNRSTALVFIMIPGVGLLYSGLLRRKNALSMLLISFLAIAVGSFQWFL